MSDVTQILEAIEHGDPHAADQLLPLVYEELRQLANAQMAREKPGQTLDATALVHEAYLRLVGARSVSAGFANRRHFFTAAAEAMRRILIDSARRKRRQKRGGDGRRIDLDLLSPAGAQPDDEVLALNEALDRLAAEEPVVVEVVKLRYFTGLTIADVAATLGISVRTANRHWSYARAWLFQALREQSPAE